MKRSELFFGALLVPVDFTALFLAGIAAYYLRISRFAQDIRPAVFEAELPLSEHMQLVSIVAVVIMAIFSLQGLYTLQVTRRLLDEFTRIFSGVSIGVMLVVLAIFLSAEQFESRFIILLAYFLAIIFVTAARYAVKRIQQNLLRKGFGIHRVLLVGKNKVSRELTDLFVRLPQLGYRVVSNVDRVRPDVLDDIYYQRGVDEVIQADPMLPDEDNLLLLDFCEQYKIDYKYVPNLFETYAVNVQYRQVGSIPLLALMRTPLDGWGRIAKRFVDVIGSAFGIVLLSPLLLLTALAITYDSKGPVFYRQVRVGRNMIPFEMIKFRSMFIEDCVGLQYGGKKAEEKYKKLRQASNERNGPLFKMKDDPRITRVGRFIRRWRIDELPQLFNVFTGEMSLFGPRPHLPVEVKQYSKYHRKLFTIKPGMSGMAQVAGNAGLSFEEEANIDIAYIENWSLWVDAVLLLKTLKILFTDRNAV